MIKKHGFLFECEECGKKFDKKINLKNHARSHADSKPYECEECNTTFSTKSYLMKHLKTHNLSEESTGLNEATFLIAGVDTLEEATCQCNHCITIDIAIEKLKSMKHSHQSKVF